MCGPFVLAQTAGSPASVTLRQLKRGLLLHYHLGRLVTYAALGAAAATLGAGVIAAGPFDLAVALLVAFAARPGYSTNSWRYRWPWPGW